MDFGGTPEGFRNEPLKGLQRYCGETPADSGKPPENLALGGFTQSGGTWLLICGQVAVEVRRLRSGMFLSVRLRTSYVCFELFVPPQPYGFWGLKPFGAEAIWG